MRLLLLLLPFYGLGFRGILASVQDTGPFYSTQFPNVQWNHEKWQLRNTELDQGHYQSRMHLSNGYLGCAVAALGPFFEVDFPVNGDNIGGWPLFSRRQTFATVGGFWNYQDRTNGTNFPWLLQYGGESVISGLPHWAGIVLDLGQETYLDAGASNETISDFKSTMDFKQGRMLWSFTWTPYEDIRFSVSFEMIIHKLYLNQAMVRMQVTPSVDYTAMVVNVLNGDCAVRSDFIDKGMDQDMVYSAVRPSGIDNVTGIIYAGMTSEGICASLTDTDVSRRPYAGNNESSIAQAFDVKFKAGKTAAFTKYIGVASSDAFEDPGDSARQAAIQGMRTGYVDSLKSHVREWAYVFPEDSVDGYELEDGTLPDDGFLVESAIAAVANPFYILQNTVGQNAITALEKNLLVNQHSIAVGGLASDAYAGWIFWDAEIWMQPGLVAAFPESAKGIAEYRVATYAQALENPSTAYQSSKNDTVFSENAATYPWISGRYGNCTAAGPCFDYEYHINGDIALEFEHYWVVSGDTRYFRDELFPIYDSVAVFLSEILEQNAEGMFELRNMTDPDEFANAIDNGAFTMPLIADTITNANMFRAKFGIEPEKSWQNQADNVVISRDEEAGITLEYTGMNASINVKQADVVLLTYPLSYTGRNYSESDSLADLDYYAAKQSADGPAMTYGIFSIVANEVSPSGCSAYTYQQYSVHPYLRGPWFQFSEQLLDNFQINGGFHPAFPFLTGHGGANQVILFGYLGLRLIPDGYLHVNPSLPPQIPQLRYRTFYWQGWPIQAFSNYTVTTLMRPALKSPLATANTTFADAPIPVVIGERVPSTSPVLALEPNSTVVVQNRTPGSVRTVAGNLVQCRQVWSNDQVVPGQFAISAVDGAASTKWQPASARGESSITVSLEPDESADEQEESQRVVTSFYFDWAQSPPVRFAVDFHNGTGTAETVVFSDRVAISDPYNPATAAEIVPYRGNTTNVTLPEPVPITQRYATLRVSGSQAIGEGDQFNASQPGPEVAEWAIIMASKKADAALGGDVRTSWGVKEMMADLGEEQPLRR